MNSLFRPQALAHRYGARSRSRTTTPLRRGIGWAMTALVACLLLLAAWLHGWRLDGTAGSASNLLAWLLRRLG